MNGTTKFITSLTRYDDHHVQQPRLNLAHTVKNGKVRFYSLLKDSSFPTDPCIRSYQFLLVVNGTVILLGIVGHCSNIMGYAYPDEGCVFKPHIYLPHILFTPNFNKSLVSTALISKMSK
jgi:hypothetical protein